MLGHRTLTSCMALQESSALLQIDMDTRLQEETYLERGTLVTDKNNEPDTATIIQTQRSSEEIGSRHGSYTLSTFDCSLDSPGRQFRCLRCCLTLSLLRALAPSERTSTQTDQLGWGVACAYVLHIGPRTKIPQESASSIMLCSALSVQAVLTHALFLYAVHRACPERL